MATRRALIWPGVAIGLVLGASAARAAGELPSGSVGDLLQQLQPPGTQQPGARPRGEVRVEAALERGPAGPAVLITLTPLGATKLIADPGITVTPAARPGLAWQVGLPVRRQAEDRAYLPVPQQLRLPFAATDQAPLELQVEYAYCVVDYQCFYGEQQLVVANPPGS